ncbi:uncharacterized protein LOC112905860 [Agrilus planipennis]|uniref:Uncharacterized protein LOC112905860 n=1 Tax=Agrilus planipennis TaxID=224129 RepID=A0A7F5RG99_AGRPL|nr:uncharacterized protein LOC112905860 [Agrilus planipennis]
MKVAIFMGFLVCLNLATTDAADMSERLLHFKGVVGSVDPFKLSDVSLVFSDDISVTLKSGSIGNFSRFELTQNDVVDGVINATLYYPSIDYSVDRLSVSSKKLGINYVVPFLRGSFLGIFEKVTHLFSHNPLKMETFLLSVEVSDLVVQGSAKVNGSVLNLKVGKEGVKPFNNLVAKYAEAGSKLLMDIFNDYLIINRL